jgi:hypothetical protein
MTNDSIFHVIDRFMAIINLSIQLWRVCALYHFARPVIFYCQLGAITFAIFCFLNSQDAQIDKDSDAFIFWHNFWHTFPFFGIMIECFDYFYLGDFDSEISIQELTSSDQAVHKKWTFYSLWTEFEITTLFGLGPSSVEFDDDRNDGKKLK